MVCDRCCYVCVAALLTEPLCMLDGHVDLSTRIVYTSSLGLVYQIGQEVGRDPQCQTIFFSEGVCMSMWLGCLDEL